MDIEGFDDGGYNDYIRMCLEDEAFAPPPVAPVRPLDEIFTTSVQDAVNAQASGRPPHWLRKWMSKQQDGSCVYCGTALYVGTPAPGKTVAVADMLVPSALGGPKTPETENAVLCCTTCKREKRDMDWVALGKTATPALHAVLSKRRLTVLQQSLNHGLPLSIKSTKAGLDAFERRWAAPRVTIHAGVYADRGLLAWDMAMLPAQRNADLAVQLMRGFGGKNRSTDGIALFELPPDRWFTAAWDFIEQNALLVQPAMTPEETMAYPRMLVERREEHEERWHVVLTGNRWLQESRRVARWSLQAKPVRAHVLRERAETARHAPVTSAMSKLDALFGVAA